MKTLRCLLYAISLLANKKTSFGNSHDGEGFNSLLFKNQVDDGEGFNSSLFKNQVNDGEGFNSSLFKNQVVSSLKRSFKTPNGNYDVHEERLSWHKAYETCYKDGKHLAVINSNAEAEVLKYMMRTVPKVPRFHIGFHSLFAEGKLRGSIFGLSLEKTGYEEWAPNEPTGNPKEFCINMDREAKLHDIFCTSPEPFICESFL